MIKIKHVLTAMFFLVITMIFAGNGFCEYSLLGEANKKLLEAKSIRLDFIQSSLITEMEEVIISEGFFLYVAPQKEGEMPKIRLEYTDPKEEQQYLVFDGKILWTYRKNINQVIKAEVKPQDMKKDASIFLPQWLDSLLLKSEIGPPEKTAKGWIKYVIKASGEENNFKKVELYIDPESKDLKKYTMIGDNNNIIEVTVKAAKYNVTFDSKMFVFKPPKGAEILDNLLQ